MNLLSIVGPRLDNICQIKRKWYYSSGWKKFQSKRGPGNITPISTGYAFEFIYVPVFFSPTEFCQQLDLLVVRNWQNCLSNACTKITRSLQRQVSQRIINKVVELFFIPNELNPQGRYNENYSNPTKENILPRKDRNGEYVSFGDKILEASTF